MEKCAPNADVPFDAEVNLAAKGKLLAGKKAQLIVKVSADSLYPDDASVGDLLLKPPLEMTFNGDDAKLEKWHLNCDPAAHPFSDRDSKKYIPKYEEPSDPMKPTDEIQKIAAEQFDYCAKTLVDKHRVFYWWSDHAHYHAADIGKKMNDWVKFFLHPHVRGGILPDSPGWKNIYGPLAAWSGYLHDLGMGANERLRAELDFLEGRDGADLEARATLAADTFKELGVTRVPLDRLGTYLGLLGKPVDEVKRRGLRAIAKEYLANHDDGIRSRHSLNSTLYCIGEKHASADKLRKHFSKYLLQKLAMTVCMHSKSRYGKKAMTFDALDTGYKDIKKNADNLFGALDAKDGTAKEGPKMEKWGPWLSAGLKFTFATDVAAAVNAPFDSPAVVSNEREYEDVLAKCIGVVDNMRDRGNEGKFRDNQGVGFKKLPLDKFEQDILDAARSATPAPGDPGPRRVQCGSFRLEPKLAGLDGCKTYLEVVRLVNKNHSKLSGIFGKPEDLGGDAADTRFAAVVHPAILAAVADHPDNDVLVPPRGWAFNLGELGIVHTELFAAGDAQAKTGAAFPANIDKDRVVDYVKIDTDRDPGDVAHIVNDITAEGPRAFGSSWVIALDVDSNSKTTVEEWLSQGFRAKAWKRRPDWTPFDDTLKSVAIDPTKVMFIEETVRLKDWWALWPYDATSWAKTTGFKRLFAGLKEYVETGKATFLIRKDKNTWKQVATTLVQSLAARA